MYKGIVLFILLFISIHYAFSQSSSAEFERLRAYTKMQSPNKRDSATRYFTNMLENKVHYLYPLYQALGMEAQFRTIFGDKNYYSNLSPFLAMVGDYRTALEYSNKEHDSLGKDIAAHIQDELSQVRDIQSMNAAAYITGRAIDAQVVMINEAHDKPLHRAFSMSLLEELYKQGFRYFAMETFSNFPGRSLNKLTVQTGFYSNEPVAGELIREALSLGYTLVSYEDTAAYRHTPMQRDSAQAANLYQVIKQDKQAKIFVHAGYGHIAETIISDSYYPMGLAFKKISGIDPLTIDQTFFTEGSNHDYGRLFYNGLMKKISVTEPLVLLRDRKPYKLVDQRGYDIIVVHPPTVYKNNRPTWLSVYDKRKQVAIAPQEKKQFLVQAYYENEYTANAENIDILVPADQTYIASDYGYYDLYLRPGKYKLVIRDAGYKVLNVKDKVVGPGD